MPLVSRFSLQCHRGCNLNCMWTKLAKKIFPKTVFKSCTKKKRKGLMISGNLNWKSQLESSRTVPSTFFISLIANKPTLFILLLDCAGKQVQIPRGRKRVRTFLVKVLQFFQLKALTNWLYSFLSFLFFLFGAIVGK